MFVKPFKGLMYNSTDLSSKITEPSDKISKEMQDKYYASDPYNFIRLNLPKDENPYASSKTPLDNGSPKGF